MQAPYVVKLGSNALVRAHGGVDHAFLAEIARQIRKLQDDGIPAVLVSSGAVASGRSLLSAQSSLGRPALAALGQAQLAFDWQAALAVSGLRAAQVLVTEHDFIDPDRCANLRRTLRQLLEHGVVPVVNENDAVSRSGDTLADNDWLAALLAVRVEASRVALLTDIDGLYDDDPRHNPNAKRIDVLPHIDRTIIERAGGPGKHGTGGMRGKILAARLASAAGIPVTIALARQDEVLLRAFHEVAEGTRVLASQRPTCDFQDLLRMTAKTHGVLIVDEDAADHLANPQGIPLEAIHTAYGSFERGDAIAITSDDGFELGRGLASLPLRTLERMLLTRDDSVAASQPIVETEKLFFLDPDPAHALCA